MLTKKDLKRKKFNQSELNKLPNVVFTPTTKIDLPPNLDTLLFLLRQLQTRNYYEKFKCDQYLLELQQQEPSEELESQIEAAKENAQKAEFARHHTHTIYTQILLHLFHTKQLELLYVQSYESKPDTKNVLSVNYGGHTHRFQVKAAHLEGFNLEDRGISLKPDPAQLEPVTDEQMLNEFGYEPIEVIRECRRLSNYLTNHAKNIREKNTKITIHNTIIGQIKKMAAAGEVTIIDNTKPQPEAVAEEAPKPKPKAKGKQKQAQATVKPQFKKPSGNRQSSSTDAEPPAKKPINVIRKRTFQLNK